MTRPKKDPADRKSETIAFRLSLVDYIRVQEAALSAKMTPSEYARTQALKGRVIVKQTQTLDHAAFDQIRRIGVNLNQLTRAANQSGEIPADLARLCARIEDFLTRHIEGQAPAPPPPEPPQMTALTYEP